MDAVMSTIESVVQIVNKVLWDYALIFLLVGDRDFLHLPSGVCPDPEVWKRVKENVR